MPETWTLWAALAAIPLLLTLATAFTKASVVLGALRVGLGAESILGTAVVLALAVLVTILVMAPTGLAIEAAVRDAGGLGAVLEGGPTEWTRVWRPLQTFVTTHADAAEVAFFSDLQTLPPDHPIVVLAAFVVTELTEALSMAVIVLVPFVMVDLLVAQILVLVGLPNQPLTSVVVPLKLLLFLGVGGWDVLLGGLAQGYAP